MTGSRRGKPVTKFEEKLASSVSDLSTSSNQLHAQQTSTSAAVQSLTPGTSGEARALRLVYCDEEGQFRMDADAVTALQLLKEPLGVISVCGRSRQGKSFILNQFLGRSSGFQVSPTHKPCTRGLWMWSIALKNTAPDGSEYSLLLLDSEGIDAYDQTGTYSIQIFSLAVLLSSMFIYNQMGGIDETALDRLSLVTQVTKHIRVRASEGQSSTAELGQFSPLFVWLLRDFYLDLMESGRRITPREYLETALQPVRGAGEAVAAKNEIRDSIRALFPDRDCFTLVRPVNNERDLQRLDRIAKAKLRPQFRSGLDALTTYVFGRTRPKQLGSTVMNGPMFAGLTQSFLDALNAGAVPTISTAWETVEEDECRRAHDMAVQSYLQVFDKDTPPDKSALQYAHEAAVHTALATYNKEVVGTGSPRLKYERQLMVTLKTLFEDYSKKLFLESELQILRQLGSLEERFRLVCHASGSTLDEAVKALDSLIAEYEQFAFGPTKWQELVKLLMKSLKGPLVDLVKSSYIGAGEYAALELKFRSAAERITIMEKQTDTAQRDAGEWRRRYESSKESYKVSSEEAATQYAVLQVENSSLQERCNAISSELEQARDEIAVCQKRYADLLAKKDSKTEQAALPMRLPGWIWGKKKDNARRHGELVATLFQGERVMSLKELKKATDDFSPGKVIGQGGSAIVYKGVLDDGSVVAIKKCSRLVSTYTESREFLNEVKILSQVHHRNLVSLLGCCIADKMLLLVYEFVPNGTLDEHLHQKQGRGPLTWNQRLNIAIQTASALDYLHSSANPPVYHLDVKPRNILLDQNLHAKVCDFGISKTVGDGYTQVLTVICGTFGYLDPQVLERNGIYSDKCDVYAFGIVLLELITAKPPLNRSGRGYNTETQRVITPRSLVEWAGNLISVGRLEEMIDPAVVETFSTPDGKESINKVAALARRCVRFNWENRPTMKGVLDALITIQKGSESPTHELEETTEIPIHENASHHFTKSHTFSSSNGYTN